MDDYTIEFKINDIVVITVNNPDGCTGDVLGSIGIIFNKDSSDYEVWAKCDDKYMPMWFGAEQMRYASPEEINSEFRNLITMYRLEKMHEHTKEEKRLGYAIKW